MTRIAPVLMLLLGGCPQLKAVDEAETGGGDAVPCAVQAVFDEGCAVSPMCHGEGATPQVVLAAGSNALFETMPDQSGLPFVDFGNTEGSWLAVKLLPNPPAGDPMPAPPYTITEEQRGIILGWIGGAELEPCGTETGSTIHACGYLDVAMTPPATSPVEKDDTGMVIPTDVGIVLENNCGCHLVDMLVSPYVDYPPLGLFRMATLADWHDNPLGPTNYEVALPRVDVEAEPAMFPMPPIGEVGCDIDGMGTNITPEDKALLVAWLEQMAPDADTWVPP